MPKVTVIVPNYNHARFLTQRIESILAQTYQDFELLYLDDASTDNSAEVFAAYASNPHVRAILNTQNTGSPFIQWNRGVREARGEYIWIAEADDYADPRLLETLVAKLDTHPGVGMAYCQSLVVDEQSKVLFSTAQWTQPLNPTHWEKDYVNNGRDECRRFLVQDNTVPNVSAVLFRKSVYEQAGGADEGMRACGDWLLYANIMLKSDVAFVSEPLNFFRQHTLSVTHTSGWNGLLLKEGYQVVDFIVRHVQVDAHVLRLSCKMRMGDWRRVMLSSQNCIPWRRNVVIYRIARRVDMLLHLRLAKLLLAVAARAVLSSVRPASTSPRTAGNVEQ